MQSCAKFNSILAVFLDMDGTIYHGNTLYPTTKPFLQFLAQNKIPYAFCSNNTSYSKEQYIERLAKFNLATVRENFYTTTDFLIDTLQTEYSNWKKI